MVKLIFKNNKIFFFYLGFFLLFGGILYFSTNSDVLLFYFNSHRSLFFNKIFVFSTSLAETFGIVSVLLILLLYRYSMFVFTVINLIITTSLVGIIKTVTNLPRPAGFFEHSSSVHLNFVEGVKMNYFLSFPSGHTTVAFAMFLILSISFENKIIKHVAFYLALMVAISRVYLLQHFFRDVYFASILGVLCVLILASLCFNAKWFKELDSKKGLLNTFKK